MGKNEIEVKDAILSKKIPKAFKKIKGLRKYYRNEKTNNNNFILSFQQFIDKFPQQRTIIDTNYKKQHVFEALCRLLLLFNFDKGELGNNKIFYKSLESTIQGNITILHFNNNVSISPP